MDWLYERTPDNSSRFVLGIDGANPLVCLGLNPSTAEPGHLDPTVSRVQEAARRNGFDGFIMLNVYPKRDTLPRQPARLVRPQPQGRERASHRRDTGRTPVDCLCRLGAGSSPRGRTCNPCSVTSSCCPKSLPFSGCAGEI